jgi:ketosteroid isomerase-like protein
MTDTQDLLAANGRFYEIFSTGDYDALDDLVAHTHPVACVHPGWLPIVGRDEVMESWRAIFDHGAPRVACVDPVPMILGTIGVVLCLERLDEGHLAASNTFAIEAGSWRLVHHHAGPTPVAPVAAPPGGTVH